LVRHDRPKRFLHTLQCWPIYEKTPGASRRIACASVASPPGSAPSTLTGGYQVLACHRAIKMQLGRGAIPFGVHGPHAVPLLTRVDGTSRVVPWPLSSSKSGAACKVMTSWTSDFITSRQSVSRRQNSGSGLSRCPIFVARSLSASHARGVGPWTDNQNPYRCCG
jgi:hypothetical protein